MLVHQCALARCSFGACQPSTDVDTINARLDCVEELGAGGEKLMDVQKVLPALADCDKVLRHFMQRSKQTGVARAQATIASTLHLKHVLQFAPQLAAALSSNGEDPPESVLLQACCRNLTAEEITTLSEYISQKVEGMAIRLSC